MKVTLQTPRRKNASMLPISTGLSGLAVGAALVYWMDPARGARRRAELKQKAIHAGKEAADAASVTARDLTYRSTGLVARLRGRLTGRKALVDDAVVVERVRARLGRLCSHPSAIEVTCRDGCITLKGLILQADVDHVLRGIENVRGVRKLENRLEPHATAEKLPGLQGGAGRRIARPELLQENWSPAARLVAGAAGVGLVKWGGFGRSLLRLAATIAGLELLLRSVTNLPMRRMIGLGAGRRAIDLRKDIHINASPEEVFSFFQHFENFPRFMSHVREVSRHGRNRWRWSVTGPAGVPVSWEAEVTEYVLNQVIAWRTVEGSLVRSAGIIHFEPDRGGTRIDIRLSYNPPGGALGHALAFALGANPKKLLDDDLVRFKSLIERGKATGRKQTVTKEELAPGSSLTSTLH